MKLNLDFYKEDICLYDDNCYSKNITEIESIITNEKSSNYDQSLGQNTSVYTFNTLSKIRRNVLDWTALDKNASFLEIGTEFGVITEMLCEKLKKVTSISFSKKEASIIKEKLEKYDNLEIIVGSLDDIKLNEKYDYISLIGCAEVVKKFFKR